MLREVAILRGAPKEDAREDAAEELRKYDWRRHPEAVLALSDALLLDRSDDVREEAAESLGKMRPFIPQAHEALIRAASADADRGVRKKARQALDSLGRRCIADCAACGPLPTRSVIQGPTIIPQEWMPFLVPEGNAGTSPSSAPRDREVPRLEPLPPTLPGAPSLSDDPPPPPTPIRSEEPIGLKVRRVGPANRRVR